jgi:uncharacterized protein
MRWLAWLALIGLVIFAIQKKKAAAAALLRKQRESQNRPEDWNANVNPTSSTNTSAPEAMLCCAHCQVYFPSSEAVYRAERAYCCSSHADQR